MLDLLTFRIERFNSLYLLIYGPSQSLCICTGGRGGLWWRASQTEKSQAAAATLVKTLHVCVRRRVTVFTFPRNAWIAPGIPTGRGEGFPPADYHYGNTTRSFQVQHASSQPEIKDIKDKDFLVHLCFGLISLILSECRSELLDHLRTARSEKRRLHQALQDFEDQFYAQTGR